MAEAVFTIHPCSACASMMGMNVCMPWTTPQKLTPNVHCQSLGCRFPDGALEVALDAGVVAHQMHLAKALQRLPRQFVHSLRLHDVGLHAHDRQPLAAQFFDRLLQCCLLDVRQDDLHAFAPEALGERAPHAAGRAGHDGDLPRELLHSCHGGVVRHRTAIYPKQTFA